MRVSQETLPCPAPPEPLVFPAFTGIQHASDLGKKKTLGKEKINEEDFSGTSVMRLFYECAKGVSSAES